MIGNACRREIEQNTRNVDDAFARELKIIPRSVYAENEERRRESAAINV